MNMRSNDQEDISVVLNDAKLNYLVHGNLKKFFLKIVIYPFNGNRKLLVFKNKS